jgi:hypothetical protein
MTDKELMQMALDAVIDAADSQNWEMQQNIDQHGEWYRRSVYLKQAAAKSQETIETLRIRLSQCERCGEKNPAEIHTCTPLEPVAVWELQEGGWDTIADRDWMESLPIGTKLYTAPPQREWQGLTDEEIKEILDCGRPNLVNIKKAEQKLKEKNA